eukprot:TRINITY_DN2329_c0_g1_i1.p1 TRINITY_DN2329_c0_g1~~TRINITY_DN2329_c0_g1_i1.p1  ORF type:complete len:1130 (-),score=171.69 TRINITY_DN2329_c0_g1_i1:442-3831(-)
MEPRTQSEEANWHTIQRLLARATVALQDLFRRIFSAAHGGVGWIDGADQAQKFLAKKEIDKLVSSIGKIQRRQVEMGILSRWDISLLNGLLSRMEWGIDMTDFVLQLGTLPAVTTVRNNISHLSELKVDQKSYMQWLKMLKASLLSLDVDQDEIELIITSPTIDQPNKSVTSEAEKTKFDSEKAAGNAEFKAGRYDAAITHYSAAMEVPSISGPDCAAILTKRALCYVKKAESNPNQAQFNYTAALQDAKDAQICCPSWTKSFYLKGVSYFGLNKPEKALIELDKAYALIPEDPHVQRMRAAAKEATHARLRKDHLNPQLNPSLADQIKQLEQVTGMEGIGLGGVTAIQAQVRQMLRSVGDRAALGLLDLSSAHDYRDGNVVQADDKRAYQLYKKAADVGVIDAKYNLALMTSRGRGCPADPMAAFHMMHDIVNNPSTLTSKNFQVQQLLNESSKPIPSLAMYSIGLQYSNGIAVQKDLFKAFEWFSKSAAAGHSAGHEAVGLAYLHGDGVAQDVTKAQQHLETAVRQGNVNALINLASFHAQGLASGLPDFEKARMYLVEAKKRGHLAADELLAHMPANMPKLPGGKALKEGPLGEFMDVMKRMEAMVQKQANPISKSKGPDRMATLFEAGDSPYVRMLQTTLGHLSECIGFYNKLQSHSSSINDVLLESITSHFYKATELADYVCSWPQSFFQIMTPILEVFYAKHSNRSEVAHFLGSCYLNCMDQRCIPFLEQATKKFPHDWILNHVYACALAFFKRYEDAVKHSELTLKRLDPKRDGHKFFEEAYILAANRRICAQYQEAIDAYQLYDRYAPFNHRKRPEVFFAIAFCKHSLKDSITAPLKPILDQEATLRQQQLEFFRNDTYPCLEVLKNLHRVQEIAEKMMQSSSSSSAKIQYFGGDAARLTHPYRAERIRISREFQSQIREDKGSIHISKTPGYSKPKIQRKYSVQACKAIKLDEMDAAEDQIYTGCVLHARVVEQALPPVGESSLFCGIEDEDGTYESLSVIKWWERFPNPQAAAKAFAVGRRIAVVNPYHRIAKDQRVMIRVDDAHSVVMNDAEDLGSVCYCCTKRLEAVNRCALCRTAIYCSKDCQNIDWKQNNHKIICGILAASASTAAPKPSQKRKK